MNRCDFLKLFGALPLVPLALKFPELKTGHLCICCGKKITSNTYETKILLNSQEIYAEMTHTEQVNLLRWYYA